MRYLSFLIITVFGLVSCKNNEMTQTVESRLQQAYLVRIKTSGSQQPSLQIILLEGQNFDIIKKMKLLDSNDDFTHKELNQRWDSVLDDVKNSYSRDNRDMFSTVGCESTLILDILLEDGISDYSSCKDVQGNGYFYSPQTVPQVFSYNSEKFNYKLNVSRIHQTIKGFIIASNTSSFIAPLEVSINYKPDQWSLVYACSSK